MWQSKPPTGIQLNKNHILSQHIIGCWLLNEESGLRVNDLSGNNNHGTLNNFEPMTASSGWVGGNHGTSLMFDGNDDYIDCGNGPSTNIVDNLSIEAWINPLQIKDCGIVAKRLGLGAANVNYDFFLSVTGSIGFYNGTTVVLSTSLISVDKWTHVGITVEGNITSFYINGEFNSIQTCTMGALNTHPLLIGSDGYLAEYINGRIGKVTVYNTTLSSKSFEQLYSHPYSMFRNL